MYMEVIRRTGLGNKAAYLMGDMMSYPKVERERKIMHDRFNYGPDKEKVNKYVELPKPKRLVKRERVGFKVIMTGIIPAKVALIVKAAKVESVERISKPKIAYRFGLNGQTKEQWVQTQRSYVKLCK